MVSPRFRSAIVLLACSSLFAILPRTQAQEFPLPQPAPEHKMLAQDIGTWDVEMKMWPAGPGSEPMVAKGEEVNRMLGKMWVISEFRCQMGPMQFEGHAQFGYDEKKKKYVGTWIDNMNGHISQMEGDYNEEKKEMVMESKGRGPDGSPMTTTNISRTIDDDHRVFEMHFHAPGGQKIKMMEINYTRKK